MGFQPSPCTPSPPPISTAPKSRASEPSHSFWLLIPLFSSWPVDMSTPSMCSALELLAKYVMAMCCHAEPSCTSGDRFSDDASLFQ
jgi:hypothetical protein